MAGVRYRDGSEAGPALPELRRVEAMTGGFHTTDAQRAQAVALRRLLIRLENGEGEDRALGADILNALDAPTLIGDPTGCMDCAFNLAEWLCQPRSDVLNRATVRLRDRVVIDGWKSAETISAADVARAMTMIILRVHLATLERAPA
jgi:hypothetical protein